MQKHPREPDAAVDNTARRTQTPNTDDASTDGVAGWTGRDPARARAETEGLRLTSPTALAGQYIRISSFGATNKVGAQRVVK